MHRSIAIALGTVFLAAGLPAALAAPAPTARAARTDEARDAKVRNLRALSRPVTLDARDQPASDLFDFLAKATGADLEPIYLTGDALEGIDPEATLTIRAEDTPALIVLERALSRAARAAGEPADAYTWQFTETGSIELGPKSALNARQTVEVYDVADLMYVVPRFEDAPEFDLSSALQSSQGGGGSSSPFQSSSQEPEPAPLAERLEALVNLIETTVEPGQWASAGGDGASIRPFNNTLVVTAPDYVHRQLAGYDFWPARLQQARVVNGRHEVRIRPDVRPRDP